jgi:hypothetical protein
LNNENNFNVLYWDDIFPKEDTVDEWFYNDLKRRIDFVKKQLP